MEDDFLGLPQQGHGGGHRYQHEEQAQPKDEPVEQFRKRLGKSRRQEKERDFEPMHGLLRVSAGLLTDKGI